MEPGSTRPKIWCAYNCTEISRLMAERKRLIELALELVWELQHLCKKPIHAEQEKELQALRDNE